MRDRTPLWTSQAIAEASRGRLAGGPFDVGGLSIDTRTLQRGDLFIALAGERDGHDFAVQAFAAGAAGALVSRPVDGGPYVQVDDTLAALNALAAAARDRAPARRCAVTGSVGKTSVTQAIAAALRLAGPSHAPVKSFNNHIGVPLTLAAMPAAAERAVFELGMNHAGEIGPLSRLVRPHVAVVTAVGAVHTEAFPDGEAGVARAKAEIFKGLEPGGTAVLNADDGWFELISDAARSHGAKVLTFGRGEDCDAQLAGLAPLSPSPQGGGAVITARLHGRTLRFPIAQSGAHWGPNSLATLLVGTALDVPVELTLEALAGFAPLGGRGSERVIGVQGGRFTLVDESYNANPVSMRAALQTLGGRGAAGRRIAVLTDMLELGADAARRHADLAGVIEAARIDLVFCAGPLMGALWEALPAARKGGYAQTAEALTPAAVEAVRPGDVVMVKGSNGSRASLLARALEQAGRQPAAAGGAG